MTEVSKELLLQRAREIAGKAAERAREADELRRLPDETVKELIDAKLFSIAAPKKQNGLELDLDILLQVAKELGRGCGSTAWVLSLLGTHNWMGCLFPEQTQAEMFAGKGYVLAPATFAPSGSLKRCDGGFRLNGRWSFGSGSMHSDWAMVSAMVEDESADVFDMRCVVLPMSEVTLEDTWHTVGMRGTGSNDMVMEEVFIPEHHTISFFDLLEGKAPGAELSGNPMHRIPLVPFLAYTAAAPAVGMGFGALDVFTDYLKSRVFMTGDKQLEKPAAQMRLAEATMEVRSAEALLDRGVQELISKAKAGHLFTPQERVSYRAEACYAATLVKRAIDRLAEAAGARAQFENHPLQRFQRDINTLRGHVVFDLDTTMELAGRVLIGLEPNQPLI